MKVSKSKPVSRRSFLGKAAITAGVTAFGADKMFVNPSGLSDSPFRLPREVWIATVSQQGMSAETSEKMVQSVLDLLEKSVIYHPDVICLPEVFMVNRVRERKTLSEKTDLSGELLKKMMDFARVNQSYMICPVYTRENGKIYNSAVVIDRQGNRMGEYRKMYLPDDELAMGLTPGPLQPPVFKTDFGIIGIQICYDINWNEAWNSLRQQGAEIIFWSSAFGGGQMVNAKAWQNKVVTVSSVGGETAKICDISGELIAKTGVWDRNLICAPVNLEKVFLHTWPSVQRFDEIKAKYGRKIRIINHHEEEWSIIESLSPDVRVKDILTEFELRTFEQLMSDSEKKNHQTRG